MAEMSSGGAGGPTRATDARRSPAQAEPGGPHGTAPRSVGPLFYIGAGGLMLAMTVEGIAVLGRQIGMPLHGAIEIIQAAILLTATVSMVSATLADLHAVVRLVISRLPPIPRRGLQRCGSLLAALFFCALAIGAVWLAIEHWDTHEESELLHIPFRPLRAVLCLALISIAGVFAYRAVVARAESQ